MPKLIIQNLHNQEVEITSESRSVLLQVQEHGVDWMYACGGKGRCTTCQMTVIRGMDLLNSPTLHELKYRNEGRLKENQRLACQSRVLSGEVIVCIPDPYKLPHLTYSGCEPMEE